MEEHPITFCPGNLNLGLIGSFQQLHSEDPVFISSCCLDPRSYPFLGLSPGLIILLSWTLQVMPDFPRKSFWADISWSLYSVTCKPRTQLDLLSLVNDRFHEGLEFKGLLPKISVM